MVSSEPFIRHHLQTFAYNRFNKVRIAVIAFWEDLVTAPPAIDPPQGPPSPSARHQEQSLYSNINSSVADTTVAVNRKIEGRFDRLHLLQRFS